MIIFYACMYVCMYVYMYVYTRYMYDVCMYVCMYVRMYAYMYMYMYVRMYVIMYVYMYKSMYVRDVCMYYKGCMHVFITFVFGKLVTKSRNEILKKVPENALYLENKTAVSIQIPSNTSI